MSLRVLYLYAGSRKKIYQAYLDGSGPDTELLGLNYLCDYGIQADFFENRWTEFFRKISFHLTDLPVLFRLHRYDIIFSSSSPITLFLVKFLLRRKKPLWVAYNSYFSRLLKRNRGIFRWIIRKGLASADAIICQVMPQKEFLEAEGLDPKKLFHVPACIDSVRYLHRPSGAPVIPGRYVVSIGRDLGRDYETLIEAVRGTDISLVIGALRRNLSQIKNIPSNVRVSWFPRESIPILLHDAAFSVVPVHGDEKMMGADCSGQFSLLEAMASGKAVITSTHVNNFIHGVDGMIVPPGDPVLLREAMTRLWNNPTEAKKMGEAAQKKAGTLFTNKRFAEGLVKVFSELTAKQ